MLEAMRRANLEPTRFQDKRSSFWVTFRNHTLMSPEAVSWLNQFAALPLNDRQRLALVYLRYNDRMANPDYQRLNRVDSVTARQELRGLVQAGLVEQQNTRRWAFYTLRVPTAAKTPDTRPNREEQVLAFVRQHGSLSNADCRQLLNFTLQQASRLLKGMHRKGLLKLKGGGRWARYELP